MCPKRGGTSRNLVANFEDLKERLYWLVELKETLKSALKLIPQSPETKYRRQVITMLSLAIRRARAEHLTRQHLEVIKKVVTLLSVEQVSRRSVIEIDRMLRNSPLEWMPFGEDDDE